MTRYVVLFKAAPAPIGEAATVSEAVAAPTGFEVLAGTFDATSSGGAARAAAEQQGKAGEYLPVSDRSFKPVSIEIETTPRAKVVR